MPMRQYMKTLSHLRAWPLPLRWATTAVAVGVSAGVRYVIFGSTEDLPFVLFFPAVIAAAILFDKGAGMFATALSAAIAVYLFMGDDPLTSPKNIIRLMLFCGVGGFIAIAAEAMRQAYLEAEQAHDDAAAAHSRAVAAEQRSAMLLDEFRHRVSNDLQRIVAVLRLHARRNPEAAAALQDAASRVRVIARVHDRLGREAARGMVDTHQFLHDLIDDFRKSVTDLRPIGFFVQAEAHQLGVARMGAVGLVVNELVTNALKHAFPDQKREGAVTVKFYREGIDFILCVGDDGVGEGAAAPAREGMGTHLVKALAAQLGGHIEVDRRSSGMTQRLVFPVTAPGDPG
jgi:two-component system, sensor histidine kinase PdtaS